MEVCNIRLHRLDNMYSKYSYSVIYEYTQRDLVYRVFVIMHNHRGERVKIEKFM